MSISVSKFSQEVLSRQLGGYKLTYKAIIAFQLPVKVLLQALLRSCKFAILWMTEVKLGIHSVQFSASHNNVVSGYVNSCGEVSS